MKGTRGTGRGKQEYKKGLWTVEEDKILMDYVRLHGKGHWNRIAKKTGLKRCGKSCRLRWMNYLSPNVKRGNFTDQEEDLIIRLHKLLGNRWSLIAKRVPGRTDNQVKNYWNTYLSKKLGIKDQTMKVGESPFLINSSENSKIVTTNFINPSKDNEDTTTKEDHIRINTNESDDQLKEIQAISAIDDINFYNTNSFWIYEDEFELSSLTMLNFSDGYYM